MSWLLTSDLNATNWNTDTALQGCECHILVDPFDDIPGWRVGIGQRVKQLVMRLNTSRKGVEPA